jgi:hypothetical protein
MSARHQQRLRLRRCFAWGAVVLFASLAGGLWFAYVHVTDSDTLIRVIKATLPHYLPGSQIAVKGAQVRPFKGEIHVTQMSVRHVLDGAPFVTATVPWLSIRHNPRAMFEGRFEPSEVVVTHPTLRVRRLKDGTWNLQSLLASPWPGPLMRTPPIQIFNGTVELSDGDDPTSPAAAILRDVTVQVQSAGKRRLAIEGTAKGDTFDRLSIQGSVDITTGRVELTGDVARLAITETLHDRMPPEIRPAVDQLGLSSGEVDLRIGRVSFDPYASPRTRYDISGHLRGGSWTCAKLPFPINELAGSFAVRDGTLSIDRAEGYYGTTTVRLEHGSCSLLESDHVPFDIELEIIDLKLDEKLRDWTPARFAKLWQEFQPRGRVSVFVAAGRDSAAGPLRKKVTINCHDVAMLYEHFRYPLDHLSGTIIWDGDRIEVQNMQTVIGEQPLSASGTIDHPGLGAVVRLDFAGRALPINTTLLDALPTNVREVIDEFGPTGTVRGNLTLRRWPAEQPAQDPRGKVLIDAVLDLNERCGMVWSGLPYPVNNLTGRLTIHPNLWKFDNMRGDNGQAEITGSGRVEKVGPGKDDLKVELHLNAVKLPLDDQLRTALPRPWQKAWAVLDPTGSADVDATIKVAPGPTDSYVLKIMPRPATGVRLRYSRAPRPGIDPGGTFELPMDQVTGLFVFNNGPVDMSNVGFRFYGAAVQFARGRVIVEDSGKFELGVSDLWVKDIRLDSRLRAIMPPVMEQFAQRLDDGRTFTLKGDMGLGWSGKPGVPVWCQWRNATVVFVDNSVQIQPGLGIKNIQGQLDHVHGWTDGETFDVHGAMRLESVSLLGQQLTRLETPIDVDHGVARLDDLRGDLLGGELGGKLSVSLATTPRYTASLAVRNADLQQYTRTMPGRQTFRGLVSGRLDLSGFGGDVRTLQGTGEAHIVNGELGELPGFVRLVKILNRSDPSKTAFDSADIFLRIRDGKSSLDSIRFTGDAFSLHGFGTMDVQGDLDMRLRVLYGRDKLHFRYVSDALREASGKFLVVRVQGTPSYPKFKLEPLPEAGDAIKSLGRGAARAGLPQR